MLCNKWKQNGPDLFMSLTREPQDQLLQNLLVTEDIFICENVSFAGSEQD